MGATEVLKRVLGLSFVCYPQGLQLYACRIDGVEFEAWAYATGARLAARVLLIRRAKDNSSAVAVLPEIENPESMSEEIRRRPAGAHRGVMPIEGVG